MRNPALTELTTFYLIEKNNQGKSVQTLYGVFPEHDKDGDDIFGFKLILKNADKTKLTVRGTVMTPIKFSDERLEELLEGNHKALADIAESRKGVYKCFIEMYDAMVRHHDRFSIVSKIKGTFIFTLQERKGGRESLRRRTGS